MPLFNIDPLARYLIKLEQFRILFCNCRMHGSLGLQESSNKPLMLDCIPEQCVDENKDYIDGNSISGCSETVDSKLQGRKRVSLNTKIELNYCFLDNSAWS